MEWSEEERVCTPMKTTLAVVVKGCRLCFTIVFLSRVGAALCELPLCVPHEPHVSGSRAGRARGEKQLTKVSKGYNSYLCLILQLAGKTRSPRNPEGPLPRVFARFCELILHMSLTSLTEVRVVRERGRAQLTKHCSRLTSTRGKTPTSSNLMTPVPVPTLPARRGACSRTRSS